MADAPQLKLYSFLCGFIRGTSAPFFDADGQTEHLDVHWSCGSYLVEHPEGRLLWDTGFPDAMAALPDGRHEGAFHFRVTKTLAASLSELGLELSDISTVGFSHLHGDHAGNADLFPGATFLIHEEEWAAFKRTNEGDADRLAAFSEDRMRLIRGDHDLFGDGSVIFREAPGHTPGHQVLCLKLPETGPVVLSGDLYYSPEDRRLKRVPAWNWDREETLRSMDGLERYIERTGATLIVHHSMEQALALSTSPIS